MMMFGSYKGYEYEQDPTTGKQKIKKKLVKGKLKSVIKIHRHVEENGDPGFYPSVNHIYDNDGRGGKKLSKPAQDLFDRWHSLAHLWAIQNGWELTKKEKVVVEVTAYFPDKKGRDTNNVFKLLADSLEHAIYDNDHYALMRTMDFIYLEKNSNISPYFELRIFKKSDEIDMGDVRKEYEAGRLLGSSLSADR